MHLLRAVQQTIEQEQLFAPHDQLLVALSGGADSVALLLLLRQLGYSCAAVHCNFQLRGEESQRDEDFVRSLCKEMQITLYTTTFSTEAYAKSEKISIEMAARQQRYAYFGELLDAGLGDYIAVAHHRDDNVETLLLNLVRGTGIDGLRGMRFKHDRIVRPLLSIPRDDLRSFLRLRNQPFVDDSTNAEPIYLRNRIRLQLLPLLRALNPSIDKTLHQTILNLREVATHYEQAITAGKRRQLTRVDADTQRLWIERLREELLPNSLLFEIFRDHGFPNARLPERTGARIYSRDWEVLRDRDTLVFRRRVDRSLEEAISVAGAGENMMETGERLALSLIDIAADFRIDPRPSYACLDADLLTFPLTLRFVGPGDRFRPFGMRGRQLLSDYMTNCKFSGYRKESQRVLCCGERIVWVVGRRIDHDYAITPNTKRALCLRWDAT